eukprot:m.40288 g.40288  ORF g.40288 m.40288 type:complete len:64 (-) comp13886_c1_seq1:96-287(-)
MYPVVQFRWWLNEREGCATSITHALCGAALHSLILVAFTWDGAQSPILVTSSWLTREMELYKA